jgi:NAD(P)-dependent dehydrogenase (short-subunit alcohol dehydrogenase family)
MAVELHEDLTGQVALVTGGNRGIGAAIADTLVEHGACVVVGARDPEPVETTDREAVRLDVTDPAEIGGAVETVVSEHDRLDILVNNAGIHGPYGPLDEGDVAGISATFEVNLIGATLCARAAIPHLCSVPGGRIVNVSSRSGQFTSGMSSGGSHYAASKAGLNGLTAALDATYADEGLLVNSASPGWVATEMGGEEAPRTPAEGADTPAWLARFAPGSPSGLFWHDREPIDW